MGDGAPSYMRKTGEIIRKDNDVIHCHPYDSTFEKIKSLSEEMPTVIPIRHPALIVTSWRKRQWIESIRRNGVSVPQSMCLENILRQWNRMGEINGFLFCVEQMPFDELEEYLNMKVNRHHGVVNSIGDYSEKQDLGSVRAFLKADWSIVEKALQTPIGKRFYTQDGFNR